MLALPRPPGQASVVTIGSPMYLASSTHWKGAPPATPSLETTMQEPELMEEARAAGVAGDLGIASFFFWGLVMTLLGWLLAERLLWVPGLLFVALGLWGGRSVFKFVATK